MNIYIPTLGRIDDQPTWDAIPAKWRKNTFLVCPVSEAKHHIAKQRNVYSCSAKGIGKTRQSIIDRATGTVLMLDDDLYFAKKVPRPEGDSRKSDSLVACSADDMHDMLGEVSSNLASYAHGSISARFMCNTAEPNGENQRNLRALAYRPDILKKHDVRFDSMELMEDFFVEVSLLTLGYPSFTVTQFVQDQKKTDAPGGCSTYRTGPAQAEAAHALAADFPGLVAVREKTTASGWESTGKTRTDVLIHWKKAYARGEMIYGRRVIKR